MNNMKRMILALALTALPLAAADINGNWKFDGNVAGNPLKMDCAIKQEGEKFSAACKPAEGGERNFDGTITGEKVQFSYRVDYQGTIYTLVYTGTVKDDSEMKGDIDVANTGGPFSAKKQPA